MLPVFCLIFKYFEISSNPFLAAKTNQNEKKIAPPSLVCHGLPENAFQVNQLYNVTWSNKQAASLGSPAKPSLLVHVAYCPAYCCEAWAS